jgi:hypothetical protein
LYSTVAKKLKKIVIPRKPVGSIVFSATKFPKIIMPLLPSIIFIVVSWALDEEL